jgi:hypothetical protein
MLLGYLVNGSFGLLFGNDLQNKNGLKGQLNLAQGFDVSSVERQTILRIGVDFGVYLSARAAFRLDRKSPAIRPCV